MKDNDIIKALERCGQHRECCYCNSVEECGSKRVLAASALDLIKRQKAEIERKTKHIAEILDEYAKFKVAAKKRETAVVRNIEQVADEEINRLKAECRNQSALWSKHFEDIFETTKEVVKSEAIKEFAYGLVTMFSNINESLSCEDIVENIKRFSNGMTEGRENDN